MMGQLLAHLWGDYLLQSDWMAENKTKNWLAAWVHAWIYAGCFAVFCFPYHPLAFLVIGLTHVFIDRLRLARYVVYAKNWLGPVPRFTPVTHHCAGFPSPTEWFRRESVGSIYAQTAEWKRLPWDACRATGYPEDRPIWLATWLLIIADNTLHLTINYLALRYL